MASITESTDLAAPPEEVWEKVGNLESYPEWLTIHVDFPDGVPQLAPDASFKQKVKIMGMPGEVTWTVREVDAPNRLAMDGKGPMGTTLRALWKLEAANGGTRLSYESEFGGAALAPMANALEKETRKSANESLEKLREIVA